MTKPMLAILLLLAAAMLPSGATAQNKSAPKSPPAAKAKAETLTLPPHAAGPKDASIVIEVWSDFECPHCKELYLRTLRRVIEDYCAAGKVYLIHRDFPLPQHAHAREASRWASAAATVGKYEEVTEALFTNQEIWSVNGNIEATVAPVLGADLAKVKQVMTAHKDEIEAAIESDLFLGHQAGVGQTPTTKISQKGAMLSLSPGNFPYATLKSYLDSQLAK
jgi:protein-disulfide isomerase